MAAADSNRPPEGSAPSSRRARRHEENQQSTSPLPSPYGQHPATSGRPSPYSPYQPSSSSSSGTSSRRDQRRPGETPGPAGRSRRRTVRPGLTDRLAETLDRRRNRRTLTFGQKLFGMATVTGMVLTGAVVAAGSSSAEVPLTRATFVSDGRWRWYNDVSLGRTESNDQYAQAQVSGLRSREHFAGFFMRYSNRGDKVLVAVSGTEWRIQPTGARMMSGTFRHSSSGLFRAEVQGQSVRLLWNGKVVTTKKLTRTYPGKAVVASIWQSSRSVRMFNVEASSLTPKPATSSSSSSSSSSSKPATSTISEPVVVPTSTSFVPTTEAPTSTPPSDTPTSTPPSQTPTSTSVPTSASVPTSTPTLTTSGGVPTSSASSASIPPPPPPTPSATTPSVPTTPLPPITGKRWLSGAAGDTMASGGFERWRGSPVGIAGVWDDTRAAQTEVYSICGGQYRTWNKPLDIAMGGIYKSAGENWQAAANGQYDGRWRQVLTTMKNCWGSRDPRNLYIRFAHEMNLANDWGVPAGQEHLYVQTFQRVANIRNQVFPGAKMVFSPNEGSGGGMGDVRRLWPGKDSGGKNYADVYALDAYNWWPHVTTAQGFQDKIMKFAGNGAPLGLERHRQFAASVGAPFAMSEWSNRGVATDGGGGGESPVFIQEYNKWLRANAGDPNNPQPGQVVYDLLFNLWREYQLNPTSVQPRTAAEYQRQRWGE